VLHLAGHTHWSDVFEARPTDKGPIDFTRWPPVAPEQPVEIVGRAAMVTTQSASHSGVTMRPNARGWGFTLLTLDGGDPVVEFRRYGVKGEEGVATASRR
jgi:hypothetical protein